MKIEEKKTKPVVIYNRVATHRIDSNKLAERDDELIAFAKQQGYEPVAVYSDTASGSVDPFKRVQFSKLAKEIKDTKPVAVIVTDYARISRNFGAYNLTRMWLLTQGIELIATYSFKQGTK